MFKKIVLAFLVFWMFTTYSDPAYSADNEPVYTELRVVDAATFNEYRYRITDEFFNLRNKFELDWSVNIASATRIWDLAKQWYNYLPDSLTNKNYYNHLKTSIERGIKFPNNISNYTEIIWAIENFLEKTNIQSVSWRVEAFPKTWNAPLTVTLRWNVADPTGTKIPSYNYTWWMHEDGKRKILGDNISLTHLFKEEWNFSIFLDVTSDHKNVKWYTDVLPFSSRADVIIKEKVASVIIKVNSISLRNENELKFTPEEARYWLLIDATSSTATSGSEFIKTTWDFWNGEVREYSWDPRVERVVFAKEWEFTVKLTLKTNELKEIERTFVINVHDPIATINTPLEEWFLWDKFTFSAQNSWSNKDLSYSWEIIDLNQDEIIFRKAWSLFTYSFENKGKYNVKMTVTEPSWEVDIDSKIIYINSRAPSADFSHSIPFPNKPNRVFFDATKSYDPDYTDDGKLKYTWIINGNRVELEDSNFNGSTWYFTFDSIWDHSVILEVRDPDSISAQKKLKVPVKSILSVEFFAFPRVAQRENFVKFVTNSPEARFYEWDFWDAETQWGKDGNISHKFVKSGIFNVKLKVRDADDKINTFSKNIYIWESNSPYSFILVQDSTRNDLAFDDNACGWEWAYMVNRVDSVSFSWKESINITGENTWLTYSWKLGNESFKNSSEFQKKFDELWCFPVKLTVKSDDNGRTHSSTTYVEVKNVKPTLSALDVRVIDDTTDPVIVNVSALWSKDKDWIIQSYLWYYYTDIDSEPQDFRATKLPSTSFVLPKVTWNYYFVVVMKDNNEERITSEEITGSKYFMTLTWDNLNTPLIKLSVDDSSVAIWDEVVFTVNAENILGQDLTKKVNYSWDFDGDWFYDKETTSNVTTNSYISSWEKHAKVKAKYKWFSNTKSLTINVSNVLKPDFWYISIGNKFIFFDKSIWKADNFEWDLWDGTVIKNTKYFNHEYTDKEVSHVVSLKISEWTKVKSIEQKVVKNVKNRILASKTWLVVFSNPSLNEENEIVLEKVTDGIYVYLWESKPDIANYVVDYDLEYDSDLNGWNDDDEDNKKLDSYTSWEAIKIVLNENKFQKARVFVKNTAWEIVDSKDITIVKNYIEENIIDLDTVIFDGVSDSIKLKIEKLKDYVNALPKEHKLKALMYVQKLQEEWSDNREKTNIILEFEGYIYDIAVANGDEIVDLLESLLVENQEDKSEKAITFNALKNLIPETVVCTDSVTSEVSNCYTDLVAKLEAIRDNWNVEENKLLWTEILDVIAVDKIMTNKQKTDFKAILVTLIYGWVANIPEEEIENVVNEENEWGSSSFLWLLMSVIKWLFIIIWWFGLIILLYYIYYLLVNKDKNIWFQDFIIEKTSGAKQVKKDASTDMELDILQDLKEEDKKSEIKSEEKVDPLQENNPILTNESKKEDNSNNIKEEKKDPLEDKNSFNEPKIWEIKDAKADEVPDWLKWNFADDTKKEETKQVDTTKQDKAKNENKPENKQIKDQNKGSESNKANSKQEKSDVPDWLKWSFEEIEKKEVVKKEEINKKEIKIEETISDEKIEEITKVEDKTIPEWLKTDSTKEDKTTKSEDVKKDSTKTKVDDNIPDWLKWSFEETEKKEVVKKQEEKKEEKTEVSQKQEIKKQETKQVEAKKQTDSKASDSKTIEKKETIKKEETPKVEKKEEPKTKKEEIKIEAKKSTPKVEEKKAPTKETTTKKVDTSKTDKIVKKQATKKEEVKKVETPKKEVVKKELETKEKTTSPEKKATTKSSKKVETKKTDTKELDKKKKKWNNTSELWDDGMTVPDWLKSDDEK